MATDDERREVAERLRRARVYTLAGKGSDGVTLKWSVALMSELAEAVGLEDAVGIEVFDRLADLIDPESGQNLDTSRDTVPKESPAVQIAPDACEHWLDGECYALRTARPVDREALLALAEEMREQTRVGKTSEGWTSVAVMKVLGYVRRIYEACGEVDG